MTFTICKHRKYRGGDVLESRASVDSPDAILAMMTRNVISEYVEVVKAIQRGVTGHHFMDDEIYTYQIVVK